MGILIQCNTFPKSHSRGYCQRATKLSKYFSCVARIPKFTWSNVPKKTSNIEKLSNQTVKRSELNIFRIFKEEIFLEILIQIVSVRHLHGLEND